MLMRDFSGILFGILFGSKLSTYLANLDYVILNNESEFLGSDTRWFLGQPYLLVPSVLIILLGMYFKEI